MTTININNLSTYNENIPDIEKITFINLGQKAYSALKFDEIVGIFSSNILDGGESIVKWDSFSFVGNNDGIKIFVKNASSKLDLESSSWEGPYINKENKFNYFTKRYLQILIVIFDDGNKNGEIESLNLTLISSQNTVKFFTKTFDIGFSPEHILISYNGTVSEDSVLRFAVAGDNTVDLGKYHFIEPNKIEKLSDFSLFSTNLKIMMEMTGNSKIPVEIDEFSLMFSGDDSVKINKESLNVEASNVNEEYSVNIYDLGNIIIGNSTIF